MFFDFWTTLDPDNAFPLFGQEHILAMIIIACILYCLLRYLTKLPSKIVTLVIATAALLVPIVEYTHTYWLYRCGQTQWYKLLPLHLCAMQSIFIPLAVFTPFRCFKEFIYSTAILGGICAIVFPVGVAGTYPFWHYQTLQTLLLHSLLIFVPLALIISGRFQPKAKAIPQVIAIFLFVASLAAYIDNHFGENYIFLRFPPADTPFAAIADIYGHGTYLLLAAICLLAVILIMYLPFYFKEYRQEKQDKAIHF